MQSAVSGFSGRCCWRLPAACGLGPWLAGWLSARLALVLGSVAAGIALIAPGLWLDFSRRPLTTPKTVARSSTLSRSG